jgi:predicted AlkP superfamily pyrophosphatase or phosphodiesterase
MKTLTCIALAFLFVISAVTCAQPPPPARPMAKRVVIISIDGLRPDVALRAAAPNIRRLMQRGSYSYWAHTVAEAYTLPAHLSMLTGVTPLRHGITWNDHIEGAYSNVPTIFERAKKAGLSTGVVTGKSKFICLNKPGTLDWFHFGDEDVERDADVAKIAIDMIRQHKPDVLFVHFGDVDSVGHANGWGSQQQLAAAEAADGAVGKVLAVLEELRILDDTVVIVTADHGGRGTQHGPNDGPSRYIPWIIAGPGINADSDLTLASDRAIGIEDTCATACAVLGITTNTELDGKPVEQAWLAKGAQLPQTATSSPASSNPNP